MCGFPKEKPRNPETCAIMEREARKMQEKQYAGDRKEQVCQSSVLEETNNKYNNATMRNNRKEQVCQSSVLEEIDNKYNKVTMRNRMPIRHQRQQIYRLGGRGGAPRGDPG